MKFDSPLVPGRFQRRYKRFFADILLDDGREVTAHCPNPGAMLGMDTPNARAMIEPANNPKRKLAWTLELLETDLGVGPVWVGANTNRANPLTAEALEQKRLAPFADYPSFRREVRYGENSRIDFLLEGEGLPPCYLEVKNVHLSRQPGLAEFPDCPTARGAKHLDELAKVAKTGAKAAVLFVIQRADVEKFTLARDLDPKLGEAHDRARAAGVAFYAARAHVAPQEVVIERLIPIKY